MIIHNYYVKRSKMPGEDASKTNNDWIIGENTSMRNTMLWPFYAWFFTLKDVLPWGPESIHGQIDYLQGCRVNVGRHQLQLAIADTMVSLCYPPSWEISSWEILRGSLVCYNCAQITWNSLLHELSSTWFFSRFEPRQLLCSLSQAGHDGPERQKIAHLRGNLARKTTLQSGPRMRDGCRITCT